VSVYASSTRQALTTDSSSVTYIPNANGKFTTYFDAAASTAYTVRFTRVNNAGTNAGVLNYTNLIVGPGIQPQGAVVGSWIPYTPAVANLGAGSSTNDGYYRQVGDSLEIKLRVVKDGTPGSGAFPVSVSIPSGFNIDTSRLPTTTQVGYGVFAAATFTGASIAFVLSGTEIGLRKTGTGTNITGSDMTAGADLDFAGLMIPVNELAGSGTVNLAQNDVEYAANASTAGAADVNTTVDTVLGPNGALVPTFTSNAANGGWNRYIQFPTPIQVGDSFIIEIQHFGTGSWIPVPSGQYASGARQGAAYYGFHIYEISDTIINLAIGAGGPQATNTIYGTTAGNWPVGSGDRYRVRKVKAGQAVGFGIVNPGTSSGLVAAAGLPGNTTGNAIAAEYVGERISSSVTASSVNTGSHTTIQSITLTAGIWDISCIVWAPSTTSLTNVDFGIATANNSNTGHIKGDTANTILCSAGTDAGGSVPASRVTISAGATYYLTCRPTGATVPLNGRISATRIA
jgi:hypothetical protein